jgi:hypothetical protein
MTLMAARTEKIEGDFCDRRGFEPILLIVQEVKFEKNIKT